MLLHLHEMLLKNLEVKWTYDRMFEPAVETAGNGTAVRVEPEFGPVARGGPPAAVAPSTAANRKKFGL